MEEKQKTVKMRWAINVTGEKVWEKYNRKRWREKKVEEQKTKITWRKEDGATKMGEQQEELGQNRMHEKENEKNGNEMEVNMKQI